MRDALGFGCAKASDGGWRSYPIRLRMSPINKQPIWIRMTAYERDSYTAVQMMRALTNVYYEYDT